VTETIMESAAGLSATCKSGFTLTPG
jgi:hypothetical protein